MNVYGFSNKSDYVISKELAEKTKLYKESGIPGILGPSHYTTDIFLAVPITYIPGAIKVGENFNVGVGEAELVKFDGTEIVYETRDDGSRIVEIVSNPRSDSVTPKSKILLVVQDTLGVWWIVDWCDLSSSSSSVSSSSSSSSLSSSSSSSSSSPSPSSSSGSSTSSSLSSSSSSSSLASCTTTDCQWVWEEDLATSQFYWFLRSKCQRTDESNSTWQKYDCDCFNAPSSSGAFPGQEIIYECGLIPLHTWCDDQGFDPYLHGPDG